MNPAEILQEHFSKQSIIHPPQFIMLNIMLQFLSASDFVTYLRGFPPQAVPADGQARNFNLGPNIVSLIPNTSSQAQEYPFAATLLGDAEFPFERIIANEQAEELRREMAEWQEWQRGQPAGRNRFLFKEGKRFFESEFGVECSVRDSAIKEVKSWGKTQELLRENIFEQGRSEQ